MPHRPEFHPLRVSAIDRLTDDAVALTFDVPEDLRDAYAFTPGQHVTVRCVAAGDDGRRTYSLCSAPGTLRIGVKRVPNGVFSAHALSRLTVGDEVEVMTPMGRFTTDIDISRSRHRAAIVAGSGITPVLSIMSSTLGCEPSSRFTLIYGNRTTESVMFLDELADLKDRFPERLQVIHVLSREPRESPLLSGRLDSGKLDELLDALVDVADIDEWFLCGPYEVIDNARLALRKRGVVDTAVRFELFHVAPPSSQPVTEQRGIEQRGIEQRGIEQRGIEQGAAPAAGACDVTVVLAGRSTSLSVATDRDVLHAVMAVRPDVPYGCTNGMCGTCRAKVVEGEVEMDHCYALDDSDLAAGFVVTCQAKPRTSRVVLDYDA